MSTGFEDLFKRFPSARSGARAGGSPVAVDDLADKLSARLRRVLARMGNGEKESAFRGRLFLVATTVRDARAYWERSAKEPRCGPLARESLSRALEQLAAIERDLP